MLRKLSVLLLTLCLLTAALTPWAAAAGGLRLETSSQEAASQAVGFSGVSSNCQSFQATFTLSNNTTCDFTTDGDLDALPGVYTAYKQEGNTLTVYVTTKSGVLTDNGTLTLGTISANDGTHFTVEKAFGVKVVGSDNSESTYPSVDQGGSTGGSDNGSNGSDNGSGGSDSGNNGGGSTGGSTGGSNGGTSTTSRAITIQSSFGGKVIASAAEAIPGKVITLTATPNSGYALQSLKVTTASGKAVSLTHQSDSKYTFTMPASAVTVSAVFEAEAVKPQMPFTDVPAGSWYYDAVQYVYEEGLMGGTGNDRFSPDLTTSRGMIVTILYRLEGSPAVSGGATFADVSSGQWYSDGVAWASASGIVTGYSNGSFGPNDTITREQMAAILYRYAKYKGYDVSARAQLSSYSDASQVASYATDSMSWAVGSGLITGTSGTTLSPAGSATRAQAAVILARFFQNLAD